MRTRCILALLPILLLALPGAALAQNQITLLDISVTPTTFGSDDCDTTFRFTLNPTLNGAFVPGLGGSSRWDIRVGDSTGCEDGVAVDASPTLSGETSYTFTATGSELFEGAFGTACEDATTSDSIFVCVTFDNASGDDIDDSVEIEVDTAPPDAPILTQVQSGDERLHLRFEPSASSDESPANWQVCYQAVSSSSDLEQSQEGEGGAGAGGGGAGGEGGVGGAGGEGGVGGTGGGGEIPSSNLCETGKRSSEIAGSRRTFVLENLVNGTTYQVAVISIDDNGNESPESNVLEGTPQAVNSFWDIYKDAGGAEDGGCSAAAGPAGLAGLFVGLFLAARKRGGR